GLEPVVGDGVADPSATGAVVVVVGPDQDARDAFATLAPAVLGGVARVLVVTRTGAAGGEPGLVRALRAELPERSIRSVRVASDLDPAALAEVAADELATVGPTSVTVRGAERVAGRVVVSDRPEDLSLADAPVVAPGAVVLLTGGARGITARVARRLA